MKIPANEVAYFDELNRPLEGRVNHLYVDKHMKLNPATGKRDLPDPLVTIATGNLVDPKQLAFGIGLCHAGTNDLATEAEISAEWDKLKSMRMQVYNHVASSQKQIVGLKLYLPDAAIDALMLSKLESNEDTLRAVAEFASMDSAPLKAKTALRGMAWAMGAAFAHKGKWPGFRRAWARQDWNAAADECRMREDDPIHKAHNDLNERLLREAAQEG